MNKSYLSSLIIFLVLIAKAYGQSTSALKKSQQPNILCITCEDMSANLTSFEDSTIVTPHLSKLASQGVRFNNMYSVSGVSVLGHSAIITGMYPTCIGTQHMRTNQLFKKIYLITKRYHP